MPDGLSLDFSGCRIRVQAGPQALIWLREFLGPSATETIGDEKPDALVLAREDAVEFDALRARGPHPAGRLVEYFALDTRMVALPACNAPHDTLVVFDDELGVFYRHAAIPADAARPRATPVIEIVWRGAERPMRVALLRVVRELASAHVVHAAGLLVHGAAFSAGGSAYVVAGSKEAGKTTMLMHLLGAGHASYMSNDRVALLVSGSTIDVTGIPTIVAVRPSSLSMFPDVAARARAAGYHHSLTLEEAHARSAATGDGAPPPDFSPAQFCELLGVSRVGHAPLSGIIFPRRTGKPGGATLEALSRASAARRLRAALFRAASPKLVGDAFWRGGTDDHRDRMCDEIAALIPCTDCWLGSNAYGEPGSAGRLLSALESTRYNPPSFVRTTSRNDQVRSRSSNPGI